jgi:hypothetical protein
MDVGPLIEYDPPVTDGPMGRMVEQQTGGRLKQTQLRDIVPFVSRIFSGPVLRELHQRGTSQYLVGVLRELAGDIFAPTTTLQEVCSATFAVLRRHYRSDYVYRSLIANKIFLGRHSPTTTVLLPELRVWRSRADLVMVNGTTTVYEIKSELDNLDKLLVQVSAYQKLFEHVNVVTSEQLASKVDQLVPQSVGLLVLTPRATIRTLRQSSSSLAHFDVSTMLDTVRTSELKTITERLFGTLPTVGNTRLFDQCADRLRMLPPDVLHRQLVAVLKARRVYRTSDFDDVPFELVAAYIESGISTSNWPRLTRQLASITIGRLIRGERDDLLPISSCETI